MQDELLEAVRNPMYWLYVAVFLSVCVTSSSAQLSEAVKLEFPAYRMQQYEVNGNAYGSKNHKVQYEAVSLDSAALRRCIISSWRDVATRDIDNILSLSVGALLIVVPADIDSLSPADKTLFLDMEKRLANTRTELAVYIVPSSSEMAGVISDVASSSSRAPTATQQLINSVAANTFQFTSTGSPATTPLTYTPRNVIGKLMGSDANSPTILFVAHYDSHSLFPGSSPSSDSNGSGVVMLLELLAILSRFYENASTRPPFNLMFAWTAGGKYNYQGTRALIEHLQNSKTENADQVQLAICIEAVGGSDDLRMHASKQPSEGSAAFQLLRRLQAAAPNQSVELVIKKISMNAPLLSWEHERFNIKRMPSITLSRLPSPDDIWRRSLLDTPSQISLETLENNIRVVAEAVLGHMLSLPEDGFSSDPRVSADSTILAKDAVDRQRLAHFVRQFASRPRSMADEVATKTTTANIMEAVRSFSKDASFMPVQLQELQVYGGLVDKLLAEKVKPAVFELFIAAGVVAYLAIFYQLVCNAQRVIEQTVHGLRKRV